MLYRTLGERCLQRNGAQLEKTRGQILTAIVSRLV